MADSVEMNWISEFVTSIMWLCTDVLCTEAQDALWVISNHAGEHDSKAACVLIKLKKYKPNTKTFWNSG